MRNQFIINVVKLLFISLATVTSTLGLRTETIVITENVATSTWMAIAWVFTIVLILSYYKSKDDVELIKLRDFEKNRSLLVNK